MAPAGVPSVIRFGDYGYGSSPECQRRLPTAWSDRREQCTRRPAYQCRTRPLDAPRPSRSVAIKSNESVFPEPTEQGNNERPVIDGDIHQDHRTPRPIRTGRFRRFLTPGMALLTVSTVTVLSAPRVAGADPISDAKAKAAQLEQQIQANEQVINTQGQRYDQAQLQLSSVNNQIAATKAKLKEDRRRVLGDKRILRKAALNAYVNEGAAAAANPLFSGQANKVQSQQEYTQIVEGNVNIALDALP